jgi:hypothetical protein
MNNMNLETKAYFDSLPVSIRSAIVESGAKFDTVEQLKVLVKAYIGRMES